jgi:hypothetical protein
VTSAFLYGSAADCSGSHSLPDIGSNASAYSTFAGVLAGFSFAALVVYLQRQPEARSNVAGGRALGSQVATGLLYSTASLIISSFLYANLVSQAADFRRAAGELLAYGGVLGLSVLVMLYSLTLMIYEVPYTRDAVKYAYLLTVIAGPAVIFRFLVDAAQLVWHSGPVLNCVQSAPVSGAISLWGGAGIAALLLISAMITVFALLHRFSWTRKKVAWLAEHPTIPAVGVFATATAVAIASIAMTNRASYIPARAWFTGPVLGAEFALLALFALTSGSVIGDRAPEVLLCRLGCAIQPPDNIQDLDSFRRWLACMASAITASRDEARNAISCGGAISFETSVGLRNDLHALSKGLQLGDWPSKPGRRAEAGRMLSIDAPVVEAERYQRHISQLQEDTTIISEWYLWFRTSSPSPDGMFGAIRIKRELSRRVLHDLDAVIHFIKLLQDRLAPSADATRNRRRRSKRRPSTGKP